MATTGATFELWLRLVWSLVRRSSMSNLIRSRKSRVSGVLATVAVSMGMMAGPAAAQNNDQDGLVNVNLQGVNVVVPIGVAANVCANVDAEVLAQQTGRTVQNCDTGDASVDQITRIQQTFGNGGPGGLTRGPN